MVALSDWTFFSVNQPSLASLRQVDGANKREVKRRTWDGANSGNNHLKRGLFSICASHFSTRFTCFSYFTAVSPLYGSSRVSLTTRTTVRRSLDQVSYLVLQELLFCPKLTELTLWDICLWNYVSVVLFVVHLLFFSRTTIVEGTRDGARQ